MKSPEIQNQFECSGTSELKIYLNLEKSSKFIWSKMTSVEKNNSKLIWIWNEQNSKFIWIRKIGFKIYLKQNDFCWKKRYVEAR